MKHLTHTIAVLIIAFLAQSCEDEIDIIAPEKDVTVIFGLINPNDTTHYVKVNRLFVGENNALLLAQDRSLAEYENIEVLIEEYIIDRNANDTTFIGSVEAMPQTITDKEPGTFYYPEQTVYAFNRDFNNGDLTNAKVPYAVIKVTKPDGSVSSSGTTLLVIENNFGVDDVMPRAPFWERRGIAFMNQSLVNENVSLSVIPPVNALGLEMNLEFEYRDVDQNGDYINDKKIRIPLGTKTLAQSPQREEDREEVKFVTTGFQFFESVANNEVQIVNEPSILKRVPDTLSLLVDLYVAGEELQTYIRLNSPSQTLLEEKPTYSNITNGIGLWSTRMRFQTRAKITDETMDELVEGLEVQLTGGLGFCHTNDPLHPKYCPKVQ